MDKGFISPSLPARLYQRNFAIYLTDFTDNPRLVTGSVYDSRERNRITVTDPFTTTYITTTFYYFEEDATIRNFLNAASFARTAHNYLDTPNDHNYIYFMFYEPSDNLVSCFIHAIIVDFDLIILISVSFSYPQSNLFINLSSVYNTFDSFRYDLINEN